MITPGQITAIMPQARPGWPDGMASAMQDWGLTGGSNAQMFLAQIAHESAGLTRFAENLNYSASRLVVVWPNRFKTLAEAAPYARNPTGLANKVYANRMGNGPEASGDGWRYRGRGPIQLTGRANYAAAAEGIQTDLLLYPNRVSEDPAVGSRVACWFWNKNGLSSLAARGDFEGITRKINGGLHGLADRKKYLEIARRVIR